MSDPNIAHNEAEDTTGTNSVNQENPIFDKDDIEKNKAMAGLAYLIFFLPLIVCPESKFAKFHANQGLLLLLFGFGGSIILGMIPLIGWLILLVWPLVVLVYGIIGMVNGFGGKAKELPLIGSIKIIK